jgi:hypothetical protein
MRHLRRLLSILCYIIHNAIECSNLGMRHNYLAAVSSRLKTFKASHECLMQTIAFGCLHDVATVGDG